MLPLLSLLLISPLRCSTMQTLLEAGSAHHPSNFLVPPPHQSSSKNQALTSETCKNIFDRCLCQPEVSDDLGGPGTLPVESVTCPNSRMTDTNELRKLLMFPNLNSATFYGNNFVEFTDRILGREKHKSLLYLNLSNNNILYLNQDVFVGLPSLQSLDLSDNALQFRESTGDWAFLRPLRFLRRLLLRHAFRRPLTNGSTQLSLLERGLRQTRLKDLQFLDLSENDFDHFPPTLVCFTPGLTHLILASNRLETLHFDKRCTIELRALDLRWNRFKYFDPAFVRTARFFGPISVQVAENPLDCSSANCTSIQSMAWFRSTSVIKDKETVRCQAKVGIAEDRDYKPDNYMLYAPLRPGMYCPEKSVSSSEQSESIGETSLDDQERRKQVNRPAASRPTKPGSPTGQQTPAAKSSADDLAITLLTMDGGGGDNETAGNNSAIALAPFGLISGSVLRIITTTTGGGIHHGCLWDGNVGCRIATEWARMLWNLTPAAELGTVVLLVAKSVQKLVLHPA